MRNILLFFTSTFVALNIFTVYASEASKMEQEYKIKEYDFDVEHHYKPLTSHQFIPFTGKMMMLDVFTAIVKSTTNKAWNNASIVDFVYSDVWNDVNEKHGKTSAYAEETLASGEKIHWHFEGTFKGDISEGVAHIKGGTGKYKNIANVEKFPIRFICKDNPDMTSVCHLKGKIKY